jgi:hypothetical protein
MLFHWTSFFLFLIFVLCCYIKINKIIPKNHIYSISIVNIFSTGGGGGGGGGGDGGDGGDEGVEKC